VFLKLGRRPAFRWLKTIVMPEISRFYGIIIYLNISDHNPPHIHAEYAEFEALFAIQTGKIIAGSLPRIAKKLVVQWINLHKVELLEDWGRAAKKETVFKITPLE
jgi:hypothetical protein